MTAIVTSIPEVRGLFVSRPMLESVPDADAVLSSEPNCQL
jgi:hypothetical protein